jgi:exonuclease SbcC
MAIKSLHIQNLQSHKDSFLEFSPGVNIIVGQSRNGKSAIFRGLEKLARNRPIIGLESWIHRHDPKNAIAVELATTDGHIISWEGPKDQRYVLDGEEFRGFGTEVPQPVAEALNLDPINTQFQFDAPYLLFDSPGQVAKTLNKIVHLDAIDKGLGNASALKRTNDRDIQAQETRLEELQALEDSFPDLEAAEEFIAELEDKEKERLDKEDKCSRLQTLQNALAARRIWLKEEQIPAGVEQQVQVLFSSLEKKDRLKYTLDLLVNLQANLARLRARKADLGKVLGQDAWVSELLTKNSLLGMKRKNLTRMKALQGQIAQARTGLLAKTAIIRQEEEKFKKMFPDICPLCERIME